MVERKKRKSFVRQKLQTKNKWAFKETFLLFLSFFSFSSAMHDGGNNLPTQGTLLLRVQYFDRTTLTEALMLTRQDDHCGWEVQTRTTCGGRSRNGWRGITQIKQIFQFIDLILEAEVL